MDELIAAGCKALGFVLGLVLIIAVVGALLNVIVFGFLWKLFGG